MTKNAKNINVKMKLPHNMKLLDDEIIDSKILMMMSMKQLQSTNIDHIAESLN